MPRRRRALLTAALVARSAVLALALLALPAPSALAQEPSRLRIAIPSDDGSLTPYTFESGYALMTLVYDTLTWRDARGVAQPWLARSVRRAGRERRVYVRLRQGITWHDGRPLTADDVAFTYDFMRRRSHPRFTTQLQDIESVHATGPLTVMFVLRRAALGFADQPLADVPILPRHLWGGLARDRSAPPGMPIGSGPYRLTGHEPGRSYRFDANRDYFRGVPSIARIDVPILRRESSIVDELRRRRVDAVPLTIPPGTTPRRLPGVTFSAEVSFNGTMLLFNVARRPFRRLAARRAVARSLDLDAIAGNASRVAGGAVPADRGMLHPGSRWARVGTLHAFEPQAARVAFAEQGIGAFRIAVARNDPVRRETARRVVRALDALGARVRLVELSPRALDRALGRRGTPATFDAAVVGIPSLASYDPAFLRAVFGDQRTAPLNDGGYRSATFADLAERMASAEREPARRKEIGELLRFLARDLPAVPLLFGGGTFAYRPRVYDRWIAVRGSGILDKRSFLRGAATAPTDRAPIESLTDPDDDDAFSLVPIIVVLTAIAVAAGVWWLRRRR